jgi:hypothetical protein
METGGSSSAQAQGGNKVVFRHDLPDLDLKDWSVTAVEVSYAPGESPPAHSHFLRCAQHARCHRGEKPRIATWPHCLSVDESRISQTRWAFPGPPWWSALPDFSPSHP